jgi:hypothetical protein
MKKICTKCGFPKEEEEFSRNTRGGNSNGRNSWCKVCMSLYSKERYKNNPRVNSDSAFRRLYGITLIEYDQMLKEQFGVCAMYGRADSSGRRLCVDHDHQTGEVRGLLCMRCNSGLGFFENNVQNLAKYLASRKEESDGR